MILLPSYLFTDPRTHHLIEMRLASSARIPAHYFPIWAALSRSMAVVCRSMARRAHCTSPTDHNQLPQKFDPAHRQSSVLAMTCSKRSNICLPTGSPQLSHNFPRWTCTFTVSET